MKAISGYVSALKSAPKEILSPFKGKNKIKHSLFAAGGAVGTYFIGGMFTSSVLTPVLNKVGAGSIMSGNITKRIVGGLVPFTMGYIGSKFIKGDIGKALIAGGAIASLAEIISPGLVVRLFHQIPFVGPQTVAVAPAAAVKGPVNGLNGLGGYVDAPSYQGTGGYVDAPSYQGTGEYVDSPSYQGTGENDEDDSLADADAVLADGYIDEGAKYMNSYLAGVN